MFRAGELIPWFDQCQNRRPYNENWVNENIPEYVILAIALLQA